MSPQLPSFLRRRLRLSEARKALLGGIPEHALRQLADPCLVGFDEAEELRGRVLDVLCREAARREAEGDAVERDRLLELVATRDPKLASTWSRRLGGESRVEVDPQASGIRREAETGLIQALEDLLEEMRDERSRSGVRRRPAEASTAGRDARYQDSEDRRPRSRKHFRLAVDDIGEFLVLQASSITVGHAHAGRADLPVTADIDPEHVRLVRTESFHAGPGWRIEATAGQSVAIGGQLLEEGGGALLDGDEVQLARNLAFVFRRADAASGSAVLELLHGAECAGVPRVILIAPGEAGRVRLGSAPGDHLQARRLEQDVTFWIDGDELVVECAGDLRAQSGGEVTVQAPGATGAGGLRVACPPTGRVAFTVGKGAAGRAPFGFSVAPAERGEGRQ